MAGFGWFGKSAGFSIRLSIFVMIIAKARHCEQAGGTLAVILKKILLKKKK